MSRAITPLSYRTIRRWTEDEARAALAALEASGLSVRAFAQREGFDHQRLYLWKRKLGSPHIKMVGRPAFVEVRPSGPERVEVVLRSGIVLRVRETISGDVLRLLVDALERPC